MLRYVKSFALIAGLLAALGMAGSASAADWCSRHIAHQQYELDKAIAHHGVYSPQADHQRRELDRVRAECRYH